MIFRLSRDTVYACTSDSLWCAWVRGCVIFWFLAAAGCGLTQREVVRSHWLDYPTPPSDSATGVPATLIVYPFLLAESVDVRTVEIPGSGGADKAVPLFLWARNPGDMITDLIQRDLAGSGLFQRTVDQFSREPYRYALEGKVLNLRGVRIAGKPTALIAVEVTLVDFGVPVAATKNIMERQYRIEAPCKDSTAEAMVQAFNDGLRELSLRLAKDIRTTLEETGSLRRSGSARGKRPLFS